MRRRMSGIVFYGLWILTAIGFAGVYWIINAQEAVANGLSDKLETVERSIVDGNWDSALGTVTDVHDTWRRIEKLWALHTQHEQLESINDVLLEAEALIYQHDTRAVAALRLARDRLHTLPERERLLWANLL